MASRCIVFPGTCERGASFMPDILTSELGKQWVSVLPQQTSLTLQSSLKSKSSFVFPFCNWVFWNKLGSSTLRLSLLCSKIHFHFNYIKKGLKAKCFLSFGVHVGGGSAGENCSWPNCIINSGYQNEESSTVGFSAQLPLDGESPMVLTTWLSLEPLCNAVTLLRYQLLLPSS